MYPRDRGALAALIAAFSTIIVVALIETMPSKWPKDFNPFAEGYATWLTAIAALSAIPLNAVSIWLLWHNLKETRKMAETAQAANAIMRDANRPWLTASVELTGCDFSDEWIDGDPSKGTYDILAASFKLSVTNIGDKPAQYVTVEATEQRYMNGSVEDYIARLEALLSSGEFRWSTAILPGQTVEVDHYSATEPCKEGDPSTTAAYGGVIAYRIGAKQGSVRFTPFLFTATKSRTGGAPLIKQLYPGEIT